MMAARVVTPSPLCYRRCVQAGQSWRITSRSWKWAMDAIRGSGSIAAAPMRCSASMSYVSKRTTDELVPKLLQVVLVSPQIPGNTGSIARTCAAANVELHLVEPLGYTVSDAKLKRAGLDYWPYVVVEIHSSWEAFYQYFMKLEGEKRLVAFTKKGTTPHTEVRYRPGDWLLFGSETEGLPNEALVESTYGPHAGGTARIPISETYVRCLNLSVSVGIGIYEALRQLDEFASLGSLERGQTSPLADDGGYL